MKRNHQSSLRALGLAIGLFGFAGQFAWADGSFFNTDLPSDPGLFDEDTESGKEDPAEEGKPWFDDSLLEVPSEYPTIQAAINAASNGDTILLHPGAYGSFVHEGAFHVTIRGPRLDGLERRHVSESDTAVIGTLEPRTLLDGPGIVIGRGSSLLLDNVCVAGWMSPPWCRAGSAIRVEEESSLHAVECVMTVNAAFSWGSSCPHDLAGCGGAAVITTGSSATFKRCGFIGNFAEADGGAIYFDMGEGETGRLDVVECHFNDNQSRGTGGDICMTNSEHVSSGYTWRYIAPNEALLQVLSSTFEAGSSKYGGSICIKSGMSFISNCQFERNHATRKGGAISLFGPSTMHVEGCAFSHNRSSGGGGAIDYGSTWIRRVAASHEGSRITSWKYIEKQHEQNLTLQRSRFDHNSSESAGGAIYGFANGLSLIECELYGNSAGHSASALFATTRFPMPDDAPMLMDNIFCGNAGEDIVFRLSSLSEDEDVDWAADGNCISDRCLVLPSGTECVHPCDIDEDGDVDTWDLMLVASALGTTCTDCPEDVDGDGDVDISDYMMVLDAYFSGA